MGVISNGTTLLDAGALDSGVATGKMTLIATITADNSASTMTFASSIDSTYDEYQFHCSNIHMSSNDSYLRVNFRDGSTAYDAVKTTSWFKSENNTSDNQGAFSYSTGDYLGQSTAVQRVSTPIGNDNDECSGGILHMYAPIANTKVTHFHSTFATQDMSDFCVNIMMAGYCNTTDAITGVQFSASQGNFQSGVIKMYGIGG